MSFVVTYQNWNERDIEASIDCRGTFETREEAEQAAESWLREMYGNDPLIEYFEWSCGIYIDDNQCDIFVVHELYKAEGG